MAKKRLHQEPIVRRIAMVLEAGEPTRFAYEGPCRHGVRAHLCLIGWTWRAADAHAALIVSLALSRIGASRPSWQDGQPEHNDHAAERWWCETCGGPIESETRWRFCSDECGAIARNRAREARLRADDEAARMAFHAARGNGAWPERQCLRCHEPFRVDPHHIRQKYCSHACARAAKAVDWGRTCATCGAGFEARYKRQSYCSPECAPQKRARPQPLKLCMRCGAAFQPRTAAEAVKRRYCSRACADADRQRCEAA